MQEAKSGFMVGRRGEFQKQWAEIQDKKKRGILVSKSHPGSVDTEMLGPIGLMTKE